MQTKQSCLIYSFKVTFRFRHFSYIDARASQNPPEHKTNSASRRHVESHTSQRKEKGTFRQIENSMALSHREHKTANNRQGLMVALGAAVILNNNEGSINMQRKQQPTGLTLSCLCILSGSSSLINMLAAPYLRQCQNILTTNTPMPVPSATNSYN